MKKLSKTTRSNFITYGMVIVFYVVMQLLSGAGMLSNSLTGQLVPICVYICMAVSLNLTVGILGELSLGHAGFMSVGAFTGIVTAMSLQQLGLASGPIRLLLALIVGGIMAAIVGVIVGVPVLRLRGDYLAIVTLAFGEIIKNIVNNLYVAFDSTGLHIKLLSVIAKEDLQDGILIINGSIGAAGITKLSTFTSGAILILFTLFVVLNLVNSRSGRAIMAIRDNRIAAESVGINITKYKLMAFVTSAALAGMAGALYAMNFTTIAAKKFDFNTSILVLVFVVLGGMGNIRGSIIAAAILTVLPEALRFLNDYRMLIYAIVLILVMLVTNNPTLKAGWERIKERLAFWRKPASVSASAEGGGSSE